MPIHALRSESLYEDAVATERPVVVFKHSTTCGVSVLALGVIQTFASQHPEVPVLAVDVLGQRDLSDAIAERLGIRHESPQTIVVRAGHAVWSTSHSRITVESLAESVISSAEL